MRTPENLNNKVFGNVTITGFNPTKTRSAWDYTCECGKTGTATSSNLKRGLTQSCGCMITISKNNRAKNITGNQYNYFTVIEKKIVKNRTLWVCKCECGAVRVFKKNYIENKATSCGCKNEDIGRRRTHGLTHSKEYRAWSGMKTRCYNNKESSWENYGGRGIKVCSRWKDSFENFKQDLGKKPSEKHTIERIDNNKNYCPENCRWATATEQANNRRSNRIIIYNGESHNIKEWSKILNIKYTTLHSRITTRGWTIEKSFEE